MYQACFHAKPTAVVLWHATTGCLRASKNELPRPGAATCSYLAKDPTRNEARPAPVLPACVLWCGVVFSYGFCVFPVSVCVFCRSCVCVCCCVHRRAQLEVVWPPVIHTVDELSGPSMDSLQVVLGNMWNALRIEHDMMQRMLFTPDESQRLARKMELAQGVKKLLADATVERTGRQNVSHCLALSHRAVPAPRFHVLESEPKHGVVELRAAIAQAGTPR